MDVYLTNTILAQNYNPHCNIILILILGTPTVTTITISRPAPNPTTDPNGNGPAISSMSQNEPNLITIGENSLQTASTLSRPGTDRPRPKLSLSHQVVLQAPGTKVRRDYQMAPKVTMLRHRDQHFNVTNSCSGDGCHLLTLLNGR